MCLLCENLSILLLTVMATLLISASCQPTGKKNNSDNIDTVAVTNTDPGNGGGRPAPPIPRSQQTLYDQYKNGRSNNASSKA
ncbi:MAG: hypothetical protein IPN95_00585 [Bacteroidetes bacterium]|nr:hypothetical protein [Bacteroidota bacterium]